MCKQEERRSGSPANQRRWWTCRLKEADVQELEKKLGILEPETQETDSSDDDMMVLEYEDTAEPMVIDSSEEE